MSMKKILVIDSSDLLRQYIKSRLEEFGFEVIVTKDGFDGMIKLKNELPDLIIMDFFLNRMNGLELLKEKTNYKTTSDIPVIILSSKIDRDLITRIVKYKVFRFLAKPIKIDLLIQAVSELFNMKLEIDQTPCIIDVHLNDDILFIEVASGLNKEKIEILKYKILQIKEIHHTEFMKILIIFTDISYSESLGGLLITFFDYVISLSQTPMNLIKILTSSETIINIVKNLPKYKNIQMTSDFMEAMDSFGKIDIFAYGEELDEIKNDIITQITSDKTDGPAILQFDSEKLKQSETLGLNENFTISIIDDDLSILEYMATVLAAHEHYHVNTYEGGEYFIKDLDKNPPDLIFLDLMMPDMNGFQVMKHLKDSNISIPIVVVTALTHKEMVIEAQKYGIKSFMSKPLKSEVLIKKAEEILKSNF
jgi:DNA-binding response OmpR family regulator